MGGAFFIHDAASGRRYRPPRGGRTVVPYTGNRRRIAVYGANAGGSGRLFRTRELFGAPAFVRCLKELHRRFGKAVVGRASMHHAKAVKKLRENKNSRSSTF